MKKNQHRRTKSNYYTLVPTHEIEMLNELAIALQESQERALKALTEAAESIVETRRYIAESTKTKKGNDNECLAYNNSNDKK